MFCDRMSLNFPVFRAGAHRKEKIAENGGTQGGTRLYFAPKCGFEWSERRRRRWRNVLKRTQMYRERYVCGCADGICVHGLRGGRLSLTPRICERLRPIWGFRKKEWRQIFSYTKCEDNFKYKLLKTWLLNLHVRVTLFLPFGVEESIIDSFSK